MNTVPLISVIVIGYRMSRQLENTLDTLRPGAQLGIGAGDYEVIVMENASSDNLSARYLASLPDNFHYCLRNETAVTPVYAVNEAFAGCRAPLICLMIDGARMVSPGILSTALKAYRMNESAVVAVPGYHLGTDEQHLAASSGELYEEEARLLGSVDWRSDGYELFRIATFSGANRRGYLQPIMECNCVFAAADSFAAIGYANTDFQLPGGGSINLHMYRSLGMLPGSELVILPGEGSFHQYHGGVTTSSYAERAAEIEKHRVQLHSYWPGGFHSLRRNPTLLGRVSPQAQPFLEKSLAFSGKRLRRLAAQGRPFWPDDIAVNSQP